MTTLRSEWLKARTTPVTWGFMALIIGMTVLNTSLSLGDPLTVLNAEAGVRHAFTAGRDFAVLFVAFGAVGAAGEFRHQTAVPTYLATPVRERVLGAKLLAHAAAGVLIAAACVLGQMAVALPWIASQAQAVAPWSAPVLEPALETLLTGAAYTAVGVALGTLVRNQVVALVVTFGWFAVAENLLALAAPGVARFLPGGLFSGTADVEVLATPVAVALLAGYGLAVATVAARTTLRQDV